MIPPPAAGTISAAKPNPSRPSPFFPHDQWLPSVLVTMEMAQSISAYPSEIQAQVSTLRAQAQAAATQASGQAATSGSGQRTGEETNGTQPQPAGVA